MTLLLQATQLSRKFGSNHAVQNLTIELHRGQVLGLLGPNGAGKSTTMQMLSGNLAPHAGSIKVNEFDLLSQPQLAKQHLGYLPENPPLLRELTVAEFLKFCAGLNGIPSKLQKQAIDSVIAKCSLDRVTQKLISHLSKGYQQRVGIAQAIIHSPAVVILDEPTSGLDPMQVHEMRSLIRQIAVEHSVILSTHILPEVETLCDRVQIIARGHLVFNDTLPKLNAQRGLSSLLVGFENPPAPDILQAIQGVIQVDSLSEKHFRCHYTLQDDPTDLLVQTAVEQHWGLLQLTPEKASLETVFMQLVKNNPEEGFH